LDVRILDEEQRLALSLLYAHHGGFVIVGALPYVANCENQHSERGWGLFVRTKNKDTDDFASTQSLRMQQWLCR
jgi:hypothetical protein